MTFITNERNIMIMHIYMWQVFMGSYNYFIHSFSYKYICTIYDSVVSTEG
jgi:hypothetical protein